MPCTNRITEDYENVKCLSQNINEIKKCYVYTFNEFQKCFLLGTASPDGFKLLRIKYIQIHIPVDPIDPPRIGMLPHEVFPCVRSC